MKEKRLRSVLKTLIWIVPYFLSYVVHVFWFLGGLLLANKLLGIDNVLLQFIVVFFCWAVVVVLASGCPLTYLHEWIEIRAGWRKKATYTFKDSALYKFFIRPFRA